MFSKIYFLSIVLFLLLSASNAQAATYVVDRNDDVAGASACTAAANDCSLRGAMNNANANGAGADIINFNVGGGNAQTITLAQALPTIQTSLTIDGSTQPLWSVVPILEINGLSAGAGAHGFFIAGGGNPVSVIIKSLVINRFSGSGIFFNATGESNLTVTGCYIGTSMNGSSDLGNGEHGIRINAVWDSTYNIGGTQTSERNVISGNGGDGININSTFGGFESADTQATLLNNFIGTTSAGNADLGNSGRGVTFAGAGFGYTLLVGGALAAQRNIISGNDKEGIFANSNSISIMGNYIGVSLNGSADLGNTLSGVRLEGEAVATVGGTIVGFNGGNVISGNNEHGIEIHGADVVANIKRNRIGTNAAGTGALGNTLDGINLYEPDTFTNVSMTIGSHTDASDGNTISGNAGDGISIGVNIRQVKIYGNRIGTNEAGTAALPNAVAGVRIESSQNEIGLAGNNIASNVISGNSHDGLLIAGSLANGNKIFNNFIGTNSSGADLGNGSNGVYINQSALGNRIGDGTTGGANRIAFNAGDGVNVADGSINAIRANSIYSNDELGIDLEGDDVTLNDAGDADSGANDEQNFPIIQRATPTRITAFLNSASEFQYEIDFYRVDSCDASNHGEGRYYLGTKQVSTDAAGNVWFDLPLTLTVGQFVTATATFPNAGAGDTSEFSQCVSVTPEPGNLSLSASAYSVNEASGTRTIVVNRSGGTATPIKVDYNMSNGTATGGQDFTPQSGTLFFADGEVVKSFNVPINNDALDETDETVNITLSNPSPGVFVTPNATAVLTIIDNDNPPTMTVEDATHEEGNLGATQFSFRIQLSGASSFPITVDYMTADGTATGGVDYVPASGTITFAPGDTLKNVVVLVIGNSTPELDETFFVNLSNATNAVLSDNQALGTILDDDNPGKFSFSFAPYTGTEHGQVQVTVTRAGGDAGTVSVDYATGGGTATPFVDYTPASGSLIFGDGETVKTFNVTLGDDQIPEPSETVNVVLSNPIGGTTLGAPSVAAINILDDDNGSLLTISGEIKKNDSTPLANATVTLQSAGGSTATTTDANGAFNFANLAPNGSYTVTPSAIGYTFAPISREYPNLANDITNANFTATNAPSRQLRVIGGDAKPSQNVNVVVELVAQGDENSAGFSLNFDPSILSLPQVSPGADALSATLVVNATQAALGKLGVIAALPAGQTFSAGTKQLVTIAFSTAPTNVYSSPVTFGSAPIAKVVVNANADALPATYLDGAVTFAQGFEADVTPRPTGKKTGTLLITDFTQIGRFVAGLDTPNQLNEFQRADCAPRVSLGNGVLDVADFTQAGRYIAGIDAVNPTGGQTAASFAEIVQLKKSGESSFVVPTVVRVVNLNAAAGNQVFVTIAADAQGTENGFGFSLNYDSTKLSAPLVTKGADTQSATLIPNVSQTGKVGVVLGMPFGEAIAAGTRHLVTVRFNVAANAPPGQTPLTFGDAPVTRAVSDVDANSLDASFQDGAVNILGPSAATVALGGRIATANGAGISKAQVTATKANGEVFYALTNAFGFYQFDDLPVGETYVVSVAHRWYQFNPSSQIVTLLEDAKSLNFTGEN